MKSLSPAYGDLVPNPINNWKLEAGLHAVMEINSAASTLIILKIKIKKLHFPVFTGNKICKFCHAELLPCDINTQYFQYSILS